MKISHAVGGIIIPDDMNCRMGKFGVDKDMALEQPLLMMRLFRHIIVIRAEYHFSNMMIEYEAMSPYFDPIPKHSNMPTYSPILTKEDGQITKIEWKRVQLISLETNDD